MENCTQVLSARRWIGGTLLLGGMASAAFLVFQAADVDWRATLAGLPVNWADLRDHAITKTKNATLLSPYFYVGVLCLFIAERLIPARAEQGTFSRGMLQDVAWFLANTLPLSTLTFMYAAFLKWLYSEYLGFLTIDAVTTWSAVSRVTMALLVSDFLGWFHHVIRHKVEFLWYFHTIHHSQQEMNLFTDHRIHFAEVMIADTLILIPSQMFLLDTITLGYFLIFIRWYTRLYHANLRTNFGFLKYFLVTPQSHRIHHSIEKPHFDKNFSTLFTIWDRMFGTLYKSYDEYPDTGVVEARFPLQTNATRFRALANYWAQTLYPFRMIRERIGAVSWSQNFSRE